MNLYRLTIAVLAIGAAALCFTGASMSDELAAANKPPASTLTVRDFVPDQGICRAKRATTIGAVLENKDKAAKANPLLDVSTVVSGGTDQLQLLVVGLGKVGDAMDFTATGVTFQVMWQSQQLLPTADATHYGADTEG